jgi:hypothetical protein
MPCPARPPCFDHSLNIRWWVQIIKLLFAFFPPVSCYFSPLELKYPQHPSLCSTPDMGAHTAQAAYSNTYDSQQQTWTSGLNPLVEYPHFSLLYISTWVQFCWPPLWLSGQSSWLQNGDVLCSLWGTNWIDICCAEESRPPLWSSGQSSCL